MKQFYRQQDAEYGPTVDHIVFQHEVDVEIFNPQVLGWTVAYEHLSVSNNNDHNTLMMPISGEQSSSRAVHW